MKKILFISIVFSVFFALFPFSSFANGESRLYDKADIIDSDAQVESMLESFEDSCKIPLFIVTTAYYGGFSLSELGINYSTDAIILEITEDLTYSIFTYGNATEKITNSEVDRILDASEVYDNIKSGRLEAGISAFLKNTKTAYLGKLQEPFYITLIISSVIAIVIAGIVSGIIIYKYKRKQKTPTYPLEKYASMIIEEQMCSDMFVGSSITRTRVSSSSSRGGGGGSRSGRRGSR